jgi:hypothetical protein
MPVLPALLATALYLIPVGVLLAARWSAWSSTRELAIEVPAAVAVDLLAIMALARFVRLDVAVLSTRGIWLAGGAIVVARRLLSGAPRERRPVPPGFLAGVGLAAAVSCALSLVLSRPFAIWDRQWHIPLVTSLRGQSIPFVNVYQPHVNLGYHVSGDVLAAALQTLSWDHLHSSAALSLAHDIMYTLTGIVIFAGLYRPGRKWWWALLAAVAPLAVLMAGPINYLGRPEGFSYHNFWQMSHRPHVVIAGLLIAGVTSGVLFGFWPQRERRPSSLLAMLASLALLAVTDEPSATLLLPALALVVFLRRRAVAVGGGRWVWLGVAASFAVVAALAMRLFPTAMVGGPHPGTEFVFPHLASLNSPPIPLFNARGLLTFAADMGPMVASIVLMAVITWRLRRREAIPAIAYAIAVLLPAWVLLTTFVAGKSPAESHRFMTLASVVVPLVALHFVEGAEAPMRWALVLVLGFSASCAVGWAYGYRNIFPIFAPDRYAAGISTADCRAATGAELGEPALPTYVPKPTFFYWSGCRPVRSPGNSAGFGKTGDFPDVGRPIDGPNAFRVLQQRFLARGEDLIVACPLDGGARDQICRLAAATGVCAPAGNAWRRCVLSPAAQGTVAAALR